MSGSVDEAAEKRVRIGIIGPSWWVDYWHLPALRNHPAAEVAAVCGFSRRDVREVRERYGPSAQYFTDYQEMLGAVTLDGVIVCTPNDLHAPATLAALERGLHVCCEKPLALNAQEARAMVEKARRKGLLGMTNFPYRDNPVMQEFRRLTAEGYLGRLLHLSGAYHGGFGLMRPPNWRGSRARSGSGILGDLGSHLIDLVRYVTCDEFSSVCAQSLTLLRRGENMPPDRIRTEDPRSGDRNDDSCVLLAELQSGAQAILHTSWVAYQGAAGQYQELEAYGTEGRLRASATHAGTLLQGMRRGEPRWNTFCLPGTTPPTPGQEENEDYFRPGRHTPTNTTYRWIEAIRAGQSVLSPDLEDGMRAQEVIDTAVRASAERRWIPVLRAEL